jgi:hypothetical protein
MVAHRERKRRERRKNRKERNGKDISVRDKGRGREEKKRRGREEGCVGCEGERGRDRVVQKQEKGEKNNRTKGEKVGHVTRGEWLGEDKNILSSQSYDATWQ